MKTQNLILKKMAALLIFAFIAIIICKAETKSKIAVIGFDTKGLIADKNLIRNMVLLELEKTNHYEVMDKYDVSDIIKTEGINVEDCYGTTCQIRAGKLLQVDKMLNGSIESIGDKIIFIFRLLDVKKRSY
jgi:hypothetical protein